MLVLHHLGISQSERIVWLLEEFELPYKLVKHVRDPILSPESLKSLPGNATGKAPFLEDTDENIALAESAAICDYINYKYGDGKLAAKPTDKNYAQYLLWFHYANGSLMPANSINTLISGGLQSDAQIVQIMKNRSKGAMQTLDDRLKDNKWLAGDMFSAADIMTLYVTSTQRYWGPSGTMGNFPNIVRWMKDCGERPAYKRAMEKGDPEMQPLLTAEDPSKGMLAAGGVDSDHWKKKNSL